MGRVHMLGSQNQVVLIHQNFCCLIVESGRLKMFR